ncbi:Gfo/Idh/MocA family protein [Nonomuraea jiangxiensis]|uniref:Predicted dehydrogenase n=1 Tax=Nonomuraea jiangxiensis TaxID=633440 RepID=A0A1G9JWH6_9ACTN|nr:Gfo/Idh/MocA family oxidoreductase [Nonomuraea jiangxiensis]SDL41223.1 Predicted dehydrogenase [Nonomuraea jiangxiensis]
MENSERLGVGIVGAGFMANFHVGSWTGVRDADVVAVQSPRAESAQALADRCRELRVGDARAYTDLRELVRDPRVDAVWVVAPNHARPAVIETIAEEVTSGRASLVGIAVEKPLGRTLAEARRVVELVEGAGLLHAYLENQVYAPAVTRAHELLWARGAALAGTPYLARCAEEHSGPHAAWFWDGTRQGGGVLSDMMCHSIEAGRYLLTPPGTDQSDWLTPVSVSARIASLKWSRKRYAAQLSARYGGAVDYTRQPAEDYAHATITFRNGDGDEVVIEATTSWSYVGPGLRLTFELLGPEYSMSAGTLNTEAQLFLSREISSPEGEDLVEKQGAEQGLLPIVSDEALTYGYTTENRAVTADFLARRQPRESLRHGAEVSELMMAAYLSAETGETVRFPVAGLDTFVPRVAQGTWRSGTD